MQKPFTLDFGEYHDKVIAIPFRFNSMFNRLRIEQYVPAQQPGVLLIDDDVLLNEALLECMADHFRHGFSALSVNKKFQAALCSRKPGTLCSASSQLHSAQRNGTLNELLGNLAVGTNQIGYLGSTLVRFAMDSTRCCSVIRKRLDISCCDVVCFLGAHDTLVLCAGAKPAVAQAVLVFDRENHAVSSGPVV